MKYDEHGFYTYEWASDNIEGFDQLGKCCQQEILLFPNVPVPCLMDREEAHEPDPLAVDPFLIGSTSSYGGGAGGSGIGPGAALLGVPFLFHSDGSAGYHSVPEASVSVLLLTGLIALWIMRKKR